MTKIFAAIMVFIMIAVGVFAIITYVDVPKTKVSEKQGYEISDDGTGKDVLTVRLKGNITTGYSWPFKIADPEIIEMVTEEYVTDNTKDNLDGAGGTYVASFRNFSGMAGETTITFEYARPWEDDVAQTQTLIISIDEGGRITVIEKEIP